MFYPWVFGIQVKCWWDSKHNLSQMQTAANLPIYFYYMTFRNGSSSVFFLNVEHTGFWLLVSLAE